MILIILIISATAASFSARVNRWLPEFARSCANLVAQQSRTKIIFKAVNYRFPNAVIIKDIKIFPGRGTTPMLQASKVVMAFTFPLFSPQTPLNQIVIKNLQMDWPVLKNYWKARPKSIKELTGRSDNRNLRLFIPEGQLRLNRNGHETPLLFTIDLDLHNSRLGAHGWWKDTDPHHFIVDGQIQNSGFDLDKLTLEDAQSSVNLWGRWRGRDINWKGFIFYDQLYILDIDGHLNIGPQDLVLSRLSFSVNEDTVTASGACLRAWPFQCSADMTYVRQSDKVSLQRPLQSIQLHLQGENTLAGPLLEGNSHFYFLYDRQSRGPLQSAHFDFKDLRPFLVNRNFLKMTIKQIQSIFVFTGQQHSLSAQNLLASINFAQPYHKVMAYSGDILTGHCHGRIFLDTPTSVWRLSGQNSFEGMDINLLGNTFPFFQQSHGLLSGNFLLQTSPAIDLSGNLVLHHGDLDNSHFQEWLANILQMPSLVHVSAGELSGHFKIAGRSKMLDDLNLHTDGFNLSGYYHVDGDDLVSSRFSVLFSKELLRESPIGRKVMDMVPGAWGLDFVFRLSGNMQRVNFQWDNSPLKNKVRAHIFSFIERLIDRRMDAHPYYKVTIPNESV